MLRRQFLGSTILLATAARATSGLANPSSSSALMTIAQQVVQSKSSPAIQIAVMKAGVLTESIALGSANLESLTAASPRSVFRIGSLTKQITGALLLKLQTEKKLSLTDPAAKYLPFLSRHAACTIKELAQHTAGIHEDQDPPLLSGEITQYRLAQALAEQKQFFDFPPGSAWLYSNANYILLGAIIESVTKQTLGQAVEKYLTGKLALAATGYDDLGQVLIGRAAGYSQTASEKEPFRNAAWIDVAQSGAAGAMRSTAAELVTLAQALLFGTLLTSTERAEFLEPSRLRNGKPASSNRFSEQDRAMGDAQYGFGIHLDHTSTRDKSLIVHHTGFIAGFSAYLATHMGSQTTVACLCNVDVNPKLPFRDIRRAVFRSVLLPPNP
jgi:CubicO group peptidase (beta-lactamase class C family)